MHHKRIIHSRTVVWLLCAAVWASLAACTTPPWDTTSEFVPAGNPQKGWHLIQQHGCHSCHAIPGIPGANSYVGPPLDKWAARQYIAGSLINTPDNLTLWILNTQEIEPGTAMPTIVMSEQEARDISAYLYSLR